MTDLEELVNSRIETLRPKLLDLSRRNPLVSTRFSDRSHSHIRVVDELPDVIFEFLSESRMRFLPLPKLEDDPKDEQTRGFQNNVSDARLTEEEYLETLDQIDQDREDSAERYLKAERELKDRIRERLGMPPRQTKGDLSLAQHARNNHIDPSYDLPEVADKHEDGRHMDKDIQTLLLPDMLERRLNALITKRRTWIQETGINVLSAAFAFLEYTDRSSSKTSLAPLILLPVTIDKKKTSEGREFWVKGLGEPPETNTVLKEKLRLDYGLDLPKFVEEQTPEEYLTQIAKLAPKSMAWRVRRQVAIGVFPSARMAMYLDLDTKKTNFGGHQVVGNLFGSAGAGDGASPFGEEYEVDDPKVESKVSAIVADADSSQFSVIVDVADGRDIAVEGPPGTGKSQTIVNTIASALSDGKKVLFVAAKMAALDVVKARLEACELGEFVLALQASRSTRKQVIKSVKSRLEMPAVHDPPDLGSLVSRFQKT